MDTLVRELTTNFRYHSESINRLSLFADQPWIMHSPNHSEGRQVYIFRQEGQKLLIFKNGVIQQQHENATWDYIESMNALLLKYDGQTMLYHRIFFDPSVLILRRDGDASLQLLFNDNHLESTREDLLHRVVKKYRQLDNSHRRKPGPGDHHYGYQAPAHTESSWQKRHSILVGKFSEMQIHFSDRLSGSIGRDRRGRYFFCKKSMLPTYYFYIDRRSCLNGLHHYLSTNKILRENFRSVQRFRDLQFKGLFFW